MMTSEHEIIHHVFQLALDPVEAAGTNVFFSPQLSEELSSEAIDKKLSLEMVERILLFTISDRYSTFDSSMLYLIACWNRADTIRRKNRPRNGDTSLQGVVLQVQRLISSYSLLMAITPELFEREDGLNMAQIMNTPTSFPWDLFYQIADRAKEDDVLLDFISPVLNLLSARMLSSLPTSSTYRAAFDVFGHVINNKNIAAIITQVESFNPETLSASQIESESLLGPFFQASPLHPSSVLTNFPDPTITSQRDINNVSEGMKHEFKVIQDHLFFISDKIIRGSPESRNNFLKYLGRIIDLNHKRLALQVQPNTVSSDGFILNISAVLIRFCEPFADVYGSKIDKISTNYFKASPLYDISDETKIVGDNASSLIFYSERVSEEPNFISHVFYLTVAYLHYGFGGAINSQNRLKKRLEDLEPRLDYMEKKLAEWGNGNGPQHIEAQRSISILRADISSTKAAHLSLKAALSLPQTFTEVFSFIMFLSVFLVRCVDPSNSHPRTPLALPLDSDAPAEFQNFPEYFVEVIPTLSIYLARSVPEVLIHKQLTPLLIFFVTFLRQPTFVNNPYVKAKFVEMIFYGVLELPNGQPGFFSEDIGTNRLALNNLFHSLMQFYIDVERTGASSQFEDKFNTRYYISQIFRRIWSTRIYRQKLEDESKSDPEFFIKFVALLLNDSTYLLDESLSKLTEIHRLQIELSASNDSSEERKRELAPQLSSAERMASSYVQLAVQTVNLLRLFTSTVPSAFVCPELVDRFAAMLDYNLDALVGPKCGDLKVPNPDKYGFKPRELLQSIIEVFLNLETQEEFAVAVARDGRSFKKEIFDRAGSILSKKALMSSADLARLDKFANKAQRIKITDEEEEEEMGDIPDEFLDPLMFTLMKDPVILPSSRVTIDLATIKSHLLSDAKDPFNRAPLKIEEVVPDDEMKQKIQDFKLSKRSGN